MANEILNKARYSSDNTDEWFTTYETVEKEVEHYKPQFQGKTVLCNCDDPFNSAFSQYFLKNFNKLKLKRLICTSYTGSLLRHEGEFDLYANSERGYVMDIRKVPAKYDKSGDYSTLIRESAELLFGDGDFRSEECVEFLKEADIVATNPPFSLFKELFSLLVEYDKKYLLISNQNAITYKEVFPLIVSNRAWIGYQFGDMSFRVPADTEPRNTRFWIDETGQKWRSLGNAMWLTNLDTDRKNLQLETPMSLASYDYPKYDGTDVIHVDKVANIPYDYDGVMGVPITFLKYHNPLMYEIVGEANHGSDNEYDLFKPKINGKECFKRILIQKKHLLPRKFKILDLFCGAGGMSAGFDSLDMFETVVALDNDDKVANTFQKNFPDASVFVGDITSQEIKNQVIKTAKERGVNMIIGGPPCQGFSSKGKKLGLADPRNFLFREYLNFVKELQPAVFVIENVRNILSASNGWFKDQILEAIKDLGYEVDYGVLNAQDFGVPQSRQRAIFLCSRVPIKLPQPNTKKPVTVREAIGDLAYLNSGEGEFEQEYKNPASSAYQKQMRKGSKHLYNHVPSDHNEIALKKLSMIPPECGKEYLPPEMLGKQQFKGTWGRLKWDLPSPTIDTRFDASSNGTNNHPVLNRAITPREAARIQSFPDTFIFYGVRKSIRKQIGNAVPPLLARAIGKEIMLAATEGQKNK